MMVSPIVNVKFDGNFEQHRQCFIPDAAVDTDGRVNTRKPSRARGGLPRAFTAMESPNSGRTYEVCPP